ETANDDLTVITDIAVDIQIGQIASGDRAVNGIVAVADGERVDAAGVGGDGISAVGIELYIVSSKNIATQITADDELAHLPLARALDQAVHPYTTLSRSETANDDLTVVADIAVHIEVGQIPSGHRTVDRVVAVSDRERIDAAGVGGDGIRAVGIERYVV